jgi:hypothetical protein
MKTQNANSPRSKRLRAYGGMILSQAHDAPDGAPDAGQQVEPTATSDDATQLPESDDLPLRALFDQSGHSLELCAPVEDAEAQRDFGDQPLALPILDGPFEYAPEWVGFAAHLEDRRNAR